MGHSQRKRKIKLKKEDIKAYTYQIIKIFLFLHSKCIIYRDLKPENILIDYNGYIKLTDFGMARRLRSPDERVNSFCGTPEYHSPEMLHHNGYGLECDIWMIGMLLYEMFHERSPFDGETTDVLFRQILTATPKYSPRVPILGRDLIM